MEQVELTTPLEAMRDQLFAMGQNLGLDADFWPVPGVPEVVLAISNKGGPCGWVVPTRPLWDMFRALGEAENPDEDATLQQIFALAQQVTITVHP